LTATTKKTKNSLDFSSLTAVFLDPKSWPQKQTKYQRGAHAANPSALRSIVNASKMGFFVAKPANAFNAKTMNQ